MISYKYYTQTENKYILKAQKGFFVAIATILLLVAVLIFLLNAPVTGKVIFAGLFFLLLALFFLLGITTKTIIDIDNRQVTVQPTVISKKAIYYFKDFSHVYFEKVTNYSIASVQLKFIVNGKQKAVHLRHSFMSTQALHDIVKETEQIINYKNK